MKETFDFLLFTRICYLLFTSQQTMYHVNQQRTKHVELNFCVVQEKVTEIKVLRVPLHSNKQIYSFRFIKLHILEKNLFNKNLFFVFLMHVLLTNCKL